MGLSDFTFGICFPPLLFSSCHYIGMFQKSWWPQSIYVVRQFHLTAGGIAMPAWGKNIRGLSFSIISESLASPARIIWNSLRGIKMPMQEAPLLHSGSCCQPDQPRMVHSASPSVSIAGGCLITSGYNAQPVLYIYIYIETARFGWNLGILSVAFRTRNSAKIQYITKPISHLIAYMWKLTSVYMIPVRLILRPVLHNKSCIEVGIHSCSLHKAGSCNITWLYRDCWTWTRHQASCTQPLINWLSSGSYKATGVALIKMQCKCVV